MNYPVWFWLGAAIVFGVLELFLPSFFMIFLSIAAVVPMVASLFGADIYWQLGLYGLALFAVFFLLRPYVLSRSKGPKDLLSRTEILVGKVGQVTETIDPLGSGGRIVVEGQDWAAASTSRFDVGATVRVVGSDSLVLKVVAFKDPGNAV